MGLGLWDTREQGEQWLRREFESGRIERVGSVMRYDRWESCYARGHRPQKLYHDHLIVDLIGMLQPTTFTCLQVDPAIEPDWEMWFGEALWYGELHRAVGQNVAELKAERFPRYADIEEPVLWVVEGNTPEAERQRLEAMYEHRGLMRNPCFVTYTDLFERTEEAILKDKDGTLRPIPEG